MASRTLEEMFSDARDIHEQGDRLEALKGAMDESVKRHDAKKDRFVPASAYGDNYNGGPIGIVKGAGPDPRTEKIAQLAEKFGQVSKGLGTDEQAAVTAALEELREMQGDLTKDITVASPGNLHPYDLEAPAKQLVPRFTPLRNELGRTKGQGVAREYRRILGYSNTGMGGVANLTPFFNSESDSGTPTFGALALRRGQKIAYSMDVKTLGYVEMSLSDMVTWKAQFSNLGFENTRSLSQMALLWAHMLGEERAMLYGRGSGSGYEGVVAAPTYAALTATGSGGTLGAGIYKAKVTSFTGQGESLPGGEVTSGSLTAGQVLQIPITVQPTGAIAYGVYLTAAGGGTGTETFQGFFVPTVNPSTIQISSLVPGGAVVPSADGSANANGYDGFLSTLSDPANAGFFSRFDVTYPGKNVFGNATAANNIGDQPWQDAFAAMYASVYADPDEVWVNVQQRRQLADFVRNAGTGAAAYRITIPETGADNVRIGAIVSGLHNESSPTDKLVDLRVHPYMPIGASFIRSRVLNIPNSGIGDTSEVISVQEYMGIDWPEIQFTYDSSTYWYGSLLHYAPKWNGCILGLQ